MSYRPGDSTYEALAPRRPRSIHKIQIKIIYRRREYRGVCCGLRVVAWAAPAGGGRVASGWWRCGLAATRDACVRVRVRVHWPCADTHYSNNDMHAVKLASKTRFSLICAQFHMNHDYFV